MNIYASILAADHLQLKNELVRAVDAGVDGIHVDVMDGHFVRDICFGPNVAKGVRAATDLPVDVHLMVDNPQDMVEEYCRLGADQITVHYEPERDIAALAEQVHRLGKRFCLALSLEMPAGAIRNLLDQVDAVLIIAVRVGIGGQTFNDLALAKAAEVYRMAKVAHREMEILVDGGVNSDNIGALRACGVTTAIVGTALFKDPNMKIALARLRAASKAAQTERTVSF